MGILFWSIDPSSLHGIPNRFYQQRLLRVIGVYSYGVYIFHLPLMYLSRHELTCWGWYDPDQISWKAALGLIALNVILTAIAAWVSFHAYEEQFLKLKR